MTPGGTETNAAVDIGVAVQEMPTGLSDAIQGKMVKVRYSYYWPPLLGVNCGRVINGECVSRMAGGLRWQDWIGKAVACPPEWPFFTKVLSDGREWVCLDRGGKIRYGDDGIPCLDFLEKQSRYHYGELIEVTLQ